MEKEINHFGSCHILLSIYSVTCPILPKGKRGNAPLHREATKKRSMRKRIRKKQPVYSSGTGTKKNILCSASLSKDKNTLIWEKIQNECKTLNKATN